MYKINIYELIIANSRRKKRNSLFPAALNAATAICSPYKRPSPNFHPLTIT